MRWLAIIAVCLCLGRSASAAQILCDPYISPASYITFGDNAVRQIDYDTAFIAFSCAVQLDEVNTDAHKRLAMIYIKRGDVAAAFELLRQIGD